jgi:hypothetical protein
VSSYRSLLWLMLSLGLTAVALIAVFAFCGRSTSNPGQPYQTSAQLVLDLGQLPNVALSPGATREAQWRLYMAVAKCMKQSPPELVKQALHDASVNHGGELAGARLMLLLRVCFECSSATTPPKAFGGWVSDSAMLDGDPSRI